MIRSVLSIAVAGLLAYAAGVGAGENLICAAVYKGSDYTAAKTDILSVDPETGEKRLVFSDEKTPIMLLQHLYVFHFPTAGGGRLFAHAARRDESVPFPGNGGLYELPADGSNRFRRIATVLGEQSLGDIFVNSEGTRIGYLNRLDRREYLFIHDVETGQITHRVDMTDRFLDCFASSIGYLPHTDRVYFSLEVGDADLTSEASYGRVATYFMDQGGEHLTRLYGVPVLDGYCPPETVRMVGVFPTGEYVFETTQYRRSRSPRQERAVISVLKVKGDFSHVEDIGFVSARTLYSGIQVNYQLSPSGKYLSAASLPVSSSATAFDIWLKTLPDGSERKILSLPADGLKGPFLGLVGWMD